jgi:hypothetical protein
MIWDHPRTLLDRPVFIPPYIFHGKRPTVMNVPYQIIHNSQFDLAKELLDTNEYHSNSKPKSNIKKILTEFINDDTDVYLHVKYSFGINPKAGDELEEKDIEEF